MVVIPDRENSSMLTASDLKLVKLLRVSSAEERSVLRVSGRLGGRECGPGWDNESMKA